MIKVITPATTEPVSYNEAKAQLRRFDDEEKTLIESYIKVARQYCEEVQHRAYIEQEILYTLDRWPSRNRILLPRAPLMSVTSVTYIDSDENSHTLDAADYTVDATVEPGMIILKNGKQWPTETLFSAGAIRVLYQAGYGAATVIPGTLVSGATQTLAAGSWSFGVFVPIENQNANNTEIVINSVIHDPGPTEVVYTAGTEYQKVRVDGLWGVVFFNAGGALITHSPVIDYDYTPTENVISPVPATVKQAILMLVAHYMENREAVAGRGHIPQQLPMSTRHLLDMNPLEWTEEFNK